MHIINTRMLNEDQQTAAFKLWNTEYPEQLMMKTRADFEQYLSTLTAANHFLLIGNTGEISGWAFKFTRESALWFAVILDSSKHRKGFGSMLLNHIKDQETELNGWVVDHDDYLLYDGARYLSPLNFYRKNGFTVIEDIRLESPHLSALKISWKKTAAIVNLS